MTPATSNTIGSKDSIIGSENYIARDLGATSFGGQGVQYGEVPQGFHAVSNVANYNYAPHPGYGNAQQGQNQHAQAAAAAINTDEIANRITDMIRTQFGL